MLRQPHENDVAPFPVHTEGMSERWSLLGLQVRNEYPEQTGYHFLEFAELEKEPHEGISLPLRNGGWACVLFVDVAHHHLLVERKFTFGRSR
jgi:hypothetical protein